MSQFFIFEQHNPGGYYVHSAELGIGKTIFVEADSTEQANLRVENLEIRGMYFNGVRKKVDCGCCCDRWYPTYSEGVSERKVPKGCYVHRLNGDFYLR